MDTKIVKKDRISEAAEILKNGGLVAFPTETVYGLGADALDSEAVKDIFKAKGRPVDNPLIVHIAEKDDLHKLVRELPEKSQVLIDAFWPGPLTLIFKKSKIVPQVTSGGLDSVAVRIPADAIAWKLIKEAKIPVAAPSANVSGRPSPTSAKHVIQDLSGKVDCIVDGGRTKIGVESTVLDITVDPPVLLRPGGVTKEELEKVVGKVETKTKKGIAKSPGMRYRHYSPKAKVVIANSAKEIRDMADKYSGKVGIIAGDKDCYKADIVKYAGDDYGEMARNLFDLFREFDQEQVEVIIVQSVEEKGLGVAIMNRLRKASSE